MKKYILTIVYNEDSDTVEWMQEEVVCTERPLEITAQSVSKLTSEDMENIMFEKEYAKA